MKIRIEVYVRANGNLMRTMEKNLVEYTDWVYQATRRGYTFEEAGNNLIVYGGKGKWDFLVLDINKEPNSDPYNPLFK